MSVRLYVGKLSFHIKSEDLKEIFSQIGEVEDAVVMNGGRKNRRGKRSHGFGFVSFSDTVAAEEAIRQLDGYPVAGHCLSIEPARERLEKQPDSG